MKYNMKKVVMMLAFAGMGFGVFAQDATVMNGVKMYNYKKYKTAESILAPLADKDPIANYYLGLSQLESGDLKKAQATFAKYPEDLANISGTARVAYMSNDIATGNKITKELAAKAKRKDWKPQKYAADAIAYTEGGDYTQAVAWYKDALSKNPDDITSIRIGLGDVMRKVPGGGGEAMNNYEAVVEKDKTNSLGYSRIGDLWYDARNYQSALENYKRAKEADAENPLPYKALADAYSRSGQYQNALTNIKEYLSHSDNTMDDQQDYVRALYQAQSFCDAATLSQKLLNSKPAPAKVIELTGILGFSQARCGDSTVALANLRKYFAMQDAKKITPGAYIEFGKLFMKLDMLDSAGAYYTKGIEGDTSGDKADAYRDVAEAFKSKKDYCKSAVWYTNLVKSGSKATANDYAWRVIAYYYCNDMAGATTAAAEFAEAYPTIPQPLYWQGRVAAAIDSEATTGGAVPYYTKWLDTVGWSSYDRKSDLKQVYSYLMYYYLNAKDSENLKLIKEKALEADPENKTVKDIEALEKQMGLAPKKPSGSK